MHIDIVGVEERVDRAGQPQRQRRDQQRPGDARLPRRHPRRQRRSQPRRQQPCRQQQQRGQRQPLAQRLADPQRLAQVRPYQRTAKQRTQRQHPASRRRHRPQQRQQQTPQQRLPAKLPQRWAARRADRARLDPVQRNAQLATAGLLMHLAGEANVQGSARAVVWQQNAIDAHPRRGGEAAPARPGGIERDGRWRRAIGTPAVGAQPQQLVAAAQVRQRQLGPPGGPAIVLARTLLDRVDAAEVAMVAPHAHIHAQRRRRHQAEPERRQRQQEEQRQRASGSDQPGSPQGLWSGDSAGELLV